MPPDGIRWENDEEPELHDQALIENAQMLADATNRTLKDVLADLEDDGILNESNLPDAHRKGQDLVEELKSAAALINVVKEINKDISENGVLNGKNNKTEVTLESTFEGDVVDRAIASVERKALKLRKIIAIVAPIILLLSGGVGLEYFLEEESNTDVGISFGCMDEGATNYDEDAQEDDESCIFLPEDDFCNPEWIYEDTSRAVNDADLLVAFKFYDSEDCDITINGHFIISLVSNGELYDEDTIDVGYFSNEVVVTQEFNDLEDGTYEVLVELHELECNDGTCSHGPNWNMDPTTIQIEVIIKGCMDEDANNYDEEVTEDDGSCEFDPEPVEGCTNSTALNYDEDATVDDDSCEYPPPRCDITLENITLSKNHNASWVHYDLNCGDESTYGSEPEGFNVSIQFWNTDVNETETLQYLVTSHYIAGDEIDTQELCLDDLEAGTYDFHWIAIWEDEEGVLFNLVEHWESIEITGV
jgi:hypothetical protein